VGGGIWAGSVSITAINCTLAQNSSGTAGSGVVCEGGATLALTNCIVWGDGLEPSCGSPSHCLLDRDPLFVKSAVLDFDRFVGVKVGEQEYRRPDFVVEAPDYRLGPASPAADAGSSEGAPATDIDGHGRPCGAVSEEPFKEDA